MNVFNAAEVLDIGIEKEVKRRDFYGLAAEKFSDKEMKDLFTHLRDWEDAHIKKFSEIRKGVEQDETAESYPGELESYMKALVDDRLYSETSQENFSRNVKSPLDAIKYGMGFEKDAILFFTELLPAIDPDSRGKVHSLIDEEKLHLVYLSELKRKYE
jgi:rubrerythrin